MIPFTFLALTCIIRVASGQFTYVGGYFRSKEWERNNDVPLIARVVFGSGVPDDLCSNDDNMFILDDITAEVQVNGGQFMSPPTLIGSCEHLRENVIEIGAIHAGFPFSEVNQNPRYRLSGILEWDGDIALAKRPESETWNTSPVITSDLPIPIHFGCPIFLEVIDEEGDTIKCYKYDKACTTGFCDDQVGNQFYVVYEPCALLLPTGSTRTLVGISAEDTEDTNGVHVGGQTLLELLLSVQSGPSSCVNVGAFSIANPSQCHLLVPNNKAKIFVYGSTKLNGVRIGASDYQCAIQTNPDELFSVTVSEVTGFDPTVINAIDPSGKENGVWQKFEIEIELKSSSSTLVGFPLCCFLFYEDGGSRHISEAQCDIFFEETSSLFTIEGWSTALTSGVTTFVIDDFEIVLSLSHQADSSQSNSAAAITFSDGSSQRWALSVNDMNDMNSNNQLIVSNNDVTISLDQSKRDEIPLDVELSLAIENGFFERTLTDCKQYSEEFPDTLTFCFHLENISPEGASLVFNFDASTLTFSFDSSLGDVTKKTGIDVTVTTDDEPVATSLVMNSDISGSPGSVFVMDLLPSTFTITKVKTEITVVLPAGLFCISQCGIDVCNEAYTFPTICYNQPFTVSSVNPNGIILFSEFQNDFGNELEITFNYVAAEGTAGNVATIVNSDPLVTQNAQGAQFTDGKFFFDFSAAETNIEYSLTIDAGFASTTIDTCDPSLSSVAYDGSFSVCFRLENISPEGESLVFDFDAKTLTFNFDSSLVETVTKALSKSVTVRDELENVYVIQNSDISVNSGNEVVMNLPSEFVITQFTTDIDVQLPADLFCITQCGENVCNEAYTFPTICHLQESLGPLSVRSVNPIGTTLLSLFRNVLEVEFNSLVVKGIDGAPAAILVQGAPIRIIRAATANFTDGNFYFEFTEAMVDIQYTLIIASTFASTTCDGEPFFSALYGETFCFYSDELVSGYITPVGTLDFDYESGMAETLTFSLPTLLGDITKNNDIDVTVTTNDKSGEMSYTIDDSDISIASGTNKVVMNLLQSGFDITELKTDIDVQLPADLFCITQCDITVCNEAYTFSTICYNQPFTVSSVSPNGTIVRSVFQDTNQNELEITFNYVAAVGTAGTKATILGPGPTDIVTQNPQVADFRDGKFIFDFNAAETNIEYSLTIDAGFASTTTDTCDPSLSSVAYTGSFSVCFRLENISPEGESLVFDFGATSTLTFNFDSSLVEGVTKTNDIDVTVTTDDESGELSYTIDGSDISVDSTNEVVMNLPSGFVIRELKTDITVVLPAGLFCITQCGINVCNVEFTFPTICFLDNQPLIPQSVDPSESNLLSSYPGFLEIEFNADVTEGTIDTEATILGSDPLVTIKAQNANFTDGKFYFEFAASDNIDYSLSIAAGFASFLDCDGNQVLSAVDTGSLSFCFYLDDISPDNTTLDFDYESGMTETLTFSFPTSLGMVSKNTTVTTDLVTVTTDDDPAVTYDIQFSEITDNSPSEFVMNLLPTSGFSITKLKTNIYVHLPAGLFCITQCTDVAVCNSDYPPMDQTFSTCYNQPLAVSSVRPSGNVLRSEFQDINQNKLEIEFNYMAEEGTAGNLARIASSDPPVTQSAQGAFSGGKFFFDFNAAKTDIEYSLTIDANFASTDIDIDTDVCDDATLPSVAYTGPLSVCFYLDDISPDNTTLDFTFVSGGQSTLTFSFDSSLGMVIKNTTDITGTTVETDDGATPYDIQFSDINAAPPSNGASVFLINLPSGFSITALKTNIDVLLPADLFCITQCTDVAVCNSDYPPTGQTFSTCYNQPLAVSLVRPSGNVLRSEFQDINQNKLEIEFNYMAEEGTAGNLARIASSDPPVTQSAQGAFSGGKFFFDFNAAKTDIEYSLTIDANFASTDIDIDTDVCDDATLPSVAYTGPLSVCFYSDDISPDNTTLDFTFVSGGQSTLTFSFDSSLGMVIKNTTDITGTTVETDDGATPYDIQFSDINAAPPSNGASVFLINLPSGFSITALKTNIDVLLPADLFCITQCTDVAVCNSDYPPTGQTFTTCYNQPLAVSLVRPSGNVLRSEFQDINQNKLEIEFNYMAEEGTAGNLARIASSDPPVTQSAQGAFSGGKFFFDFNAAKTDIEYSLTIDANFASTDIDIDTDVCDDATLPSVAYTGPLSVCFYSDDISPDNTTLDFTFVSGGQSTLTFSFDSSLGMVIKNTTDITGTTVETDDGATPYDIQFSDINAAPPSNGASVFLINLPSGFSITALKTNIDVLLPADLFCITQCTDVAVCNSDYPPTGQTFSTCYNQPLTVSSVDPSPNILLSSFQDLAIGFNYNMVEMGTPDTEATIGVDSSTALATKTAQEAQFRNGKFVFAFGGAMVDTQYSLYFQAGFVSTTTNTCDGAEISSEADDAGTLSVCFYADDISPDGTSLAFTYVSSTTATLTFSYDGTATENIIPETVTVTTDASPSSYDIGNSDFTATPSGDSTVFEINLLPSGFSIIQPKTIIDVQLPADLFCTIQCSNQDVCNSAYPPAGETFSVCYLSNDHPLIPQSVNPSGETLFSLYEGVLEIEFNADVENGMTGALARIHDGATDVETIAAANANFRNGKFYFQFAPMHDQVYTLRFDAGFASATCDGSTKIYSAEDTTDSLTFCFHERPSIDRSNITPTPLSNVLASSSDLSIGISGVQFGPTLDTGSSLVNVYKGDDLVNPIQMLDFSGTPPLLTVSGLDEVTGTLINIERENYYTVVIPTSLVKVTDCGNDYANTDSFTFTFCSIDFVLRTIRQRRVDIRRDRDIRFELTFSHDIKIGSNDPHVIISSNVAKISDGRVGNRYIIENNKATVILLFEREPHKHTVVFPAGLFIYARDDICIIPSTQATRLYEFDSANPDIVAPIPSEIAAPMAGIIQRDMEDSNPIINSQTQRFNPRVTLQNRRVTEEESNIINNLDLDIPIETNVVQIPIEIPPIQISPIERRPNQETIKRGFRERIFPNGIFRNRIEKLHQVFNEGKTNEKAIQGRAERRGSSRRRDFERFGDEITNRRINRVFEREQQINRVFE